MWLPFPGPGRNLIPCPLQDMSFALERPEWTGSPGGGGGGAVDRVRPAVGIFLQLQPTSEAKRDGAWMDHHPTGQWQKNPCLLHPCWGSLSLSNLHGVTWSGILRPGPYAARENHRARENTQTSE